MPLTSAEDFGTEKDGSKSPDYCRYCYANGEFTSETTMDEMIEICVPHVREIYGSDEASRAAMKGMFPKLKRWAV
jgi:hypothetical protein